MHPVLKISRRDALLGALCLCCANAWPRERPQANALQTHQIAPGIYVRRGAIEIATRDNQDAIANVGFVVGSKFVAVIDPGGSLADGRQLRDHIRSITRLPIRFVLMSHVHPDHIFGASAFLQDEPEFVAHAALPNALAQRADYYRQRLAEVLGPDAVGSIVQPTRLIEGRAELNLGQRILQVRAHPIAHTDHDLTAFDVQTRTLFAADLLFVERIPSLDGSLKGWLTELRVLRALKPARAVPGHGPASVEFAAAATKLESYLETLLRETRAAIAAGHDIDSAPDIVGHSERKQWLLFDEYHGHNVVQAFKELEWE